MNINSAQQFAQDVESLKSDLNRAISERIERFRADTGMTPSAVEVEMVDVRAIQDTMPQRVVGDVRLRFDI